FLVGIAIFSEDQPPEGPESHEQRRESCRPTHLQNQNKEKVSAATQCFHFVCSPRTGSAITLAKAGGEVKRCGTKGSIRRVQAGSFAKPAIICVCDEAQKTIRR